MKSDSSTGRITVSGVRDDVLAELDALADAEDKSRSEKVVELIEAEVADTVPGESGHYLPSDDALKTVYEAILGAANRSLVFRMDLHGGQVAQDAGIGKKAVRGHLFRLQRRGFVKYQQGDGLTKQNREAYRVKPRCANPKLWRYSEIRDPKAVRQIESMDLQEASETEKNPDAAQPEAAD